MIVCVFIGNSKEVYPMTLSRLTPLQRLLEVDDTRQEWFNP